VEFDDWISGDDSRLSDMLGGLGGKALRCVWLGGYARPLAASEMAD
jgi:hypothetical protein